MTGVPQALSYLIDDVGRRYGVLRLGKASTYLRSDDPALIDQAVAEASTHGGPAAQAGADCRDLHRRTCRS